jgi:hypothetical protein
MICCFKKLKFQKKYSGKACNGTLNLTGVNLLRVDLSGLDLSDGKTFQSGFIKTINS